MYKHLPFYRRDDAAGARREHRHDDGDHCREHDHDDGEHCREHRHDDEERCREHHHDDGEHRHDHHHGDGEHRHDHHHGDGEHRHDGDGCGCGGHHGGPKTVHGPDCHCEICHPHAEYCDVCGESLANCTCAMPDDDAEKAVYILENLGCANCAAKMERKIKELPGVRYAAITYATKQLRLSADDHEALLPQVQAICAAIESDVKVVAREQSPGKVTTAAWRLEGLRDINDGERLEAQVRRLDGVTAATFRASTRRLTVTATAPQQLLPRLEALCRELPGEVTPIPVVPSTYSLLGDGGKAKLAQLLVGVALFVAAIVSGDAPYLSLAFFIGAYLLLAKDVLLTAGRNMLKGRLFDENFLMALASLGAFAIGEYAEAVAVVMFFFIGDFFEDRAVARSRRRIMDAADMRPETVLLLVGDDSEEIPADAAVVGDILLVRPGDRIPLDGVVVDGESYLDTSPLTGETAPQAVAFGDEVLSGCVNSGGLLKIRVEKVLTESMVTRILHSVEQAAAGKPKLDRFITRFARYYTPCVVLLAVVTAVVPSLVGGDWYHWLHTALTFLVISCPCALVLSVPLAFFSGIGLGAKHGILFKSGASLEALNDVAAVVMDKTGTVTQGRFSVAAVEPVAGVSEAELLSAAASAERLSTHPIGHSVIAAADARGLILAYPEQGREVAGGGIRAQIGTREVLCGNGKLMADAGITFPDFAGDGVGEILVAVDGRPLGRLLLSDALKDDAADAVAELSSRGLVTAMLTGDKPATAAAVAAAAGIDEFKAGLMPQDKLTALERIRDNHGAVMFVGDGINDAPVLAGADVGAAMGSGADAAIEAADVVFMTSEMSAVPRSLRIAAKVRRVAVENVVFALAMKALVMVLGFMGYANMWLAIFADTGVAILCILNAIRILATRHLK